MMTSKKMPQDARLEKMIPKLCRALKCVEPYSDIDSDVNTDEILEDFNGDVIGLIEELIDRVNEMYGLYEYRGYLKED